MMADALMKYETIDANQIDDIMAGKEPRAPDGWNDDQDNGKGGTTAKKVDDVGKDAPSGEPPAKPA